MARNAVVLALAVEIAVFAVMTDRFFTTANFRVLLIQSSVIAILAVPTALLLISGYLDLAIGSIVGLSGVILGLTLVSWGLVPALGFTIFVAMSVGVLQGVLATRLKFPRFVVTLGFFSATVPYLAAFMALGGYRRWGVIAAVTVVGTLLLLFVFMKLVYVSLPIGRGPFAQVTLLLMQLMGIR